MKKKAGIVIALFLMLTGATGFIGGALITESVINYDKELPLGDVKGIAVDKSGQIYVGLGFYGKVQVYNSEGQFLRNWKIDASGGTFKIGLTKEQNILIATARGDKQIIYDSAGKVLSENVIDDIYSKTETPADSFITDQQAQYEVTGSIFPKIIRTDPSYEVIVEQRLLLTIMRGPLPAWLFLILGVGLMFLLMKDKIKLFRDKISGL